MWLLNAKSNFGRGRISPLPRPHSKKNTTFSSTYPFTPLHPPPKKKTTTNPQKKLDPPFLVDPTSESLNFFFALKKLRTHLYKSIEWRSCFTELKNLRDQTLHEMLGDGWDQGYHLGCDHWGWTRWTNGSGFQKQSWEQACLSKIDTFEVPGVFWQYMAV